jgi:uncharacterized membrane protein YgcG
MDLRARLPGALRETGSQFRRARRSGSGVAGVTLLVGVLALALGSCGGGGSRQDVNEPAGKFPVKIVTSSFPTRQRLAQTSLLRIGVQNTGQKPVPALAITISIDKNAIRPFSIYDPQPGLAAPDRPVWVLENDYPKLAGQKSSAGAETANDKTFDFGTLKPGKTVEAVWKVTPVRAGIYTIDYQVDAGLNGKAKAVTANGSPPTGSFAVKISSTPPQTKINSQGKVITVPESSVSGKSGGGRGGGGGASGTGGASSGGGGSGGSGGSGGGY